MSETTVVKGQFGLGQSGGTGKKLKIYISFTEMFSPPKLSTKQQKLQLVNAFITSHDLVCHCKNPGYHSLLIATEQIGKELTPKEKTQIKQCLGEEDTTGDGAEGDLGYGDLDKLFAEDFTEEDAG